jgi:DNA-binding transcriptional ArsR family regulator
MQELFQSSEKAASFLKGLASPHRLALLCLLSEGEKNVTDLIALSGLPQTSVSQHLAKLKNEGIVDFTRSHRTLTYYISSPLAQNILSNLYREFCSTHK